MRVMISMMVVLAVASVSRGQNKPIDLLAGFDAQQHAVSGQWALDGGQLRVIAERAGVCRLPGTVGLTYSLSARFTRPGGNSVVALIVPLGGQSMAVELSAWGGEAHGLARIDGLTSKAQNNPTTVAPGTLVNGQPHQVTIDVSQKDGQPAIAVTLDGKALFNWSGTPDRLQPHFVFKLDQPDALGLATAQGEIVFHEVLLTSGAAQPSAPAPPSSSAKAPALQAPSAGLAALGGAQTPGWELINGGRFSVTGAGDQVIASSVPSAGSGDRGAFLSGGQMGDGIIEVELKGAAARASSFVGVMFHGVDGETYDAVYFRPFNFKAPNADNRSHGVQYIAHPDWPWQKLRSERTGQYEKAAVPEPNPADWFAARIEIQGGRIKVFVNGADTPCLDVAKLNNRKIGKVGLWFNGIASFRNFRVTRR